MSQLANSEPDSTVRLDDDPLDARVVQVVWDDEGYADEDGDGNLIVMVIPGLIANTKQAWEQSLQKFIRETEQICNHPYRIIFVMSNFNSSAWFGWWLMQAQWVVSENHRENLRGVSIVHGSVTVRTMCLLGWGWFGRRFWDRLHYVDRLEELWLDDILNKEQVLKLVPQSVITYEQALDDEVEESRNGMISLGFPLESRPRMHRRVDLPQRTSFHDAAE